jgi:glycosyltransferase involved in cell wall biosynthesis
VPPRKIDELAAAIATLVRDPSRRVAMGNAGRALVESEFAEDIVAGETLAVYQAALREKVAQR